VSDESYEADGAPSDEVEDTSSDAPEVLSDEVLSDEVLSDEVLSDEELISEDFAELSGLIQERDELRATAQRLQADFENYRKRVERQSDEVAARQAASLASALLPALDALDLAEAHLDLDGEVSVEAKALTAARSLLSDALGKQGLEPIPGAGSPFDPTLHDAVAHAEGDGTEEGPLVDEVLRTGYLFRGVVVRPAMVRVKG
jgi:molecular chaperone GrpE